MPAKKIKIISADFGPVVAEPVKKAKKSQTLIGFAWVLIVAATMLMCHALLKTKGEGAPDLPELTEQPLPADDVAAPVRAIGAGGDSSEYREAGKQKLLDGDIVGALNDFALAVEADPNQPLNYIYRGEVLMSGNNFDAAISDFDAAIRIEPSVIAYYDRAIANIKLENLQAAKSDLDDAVNSQYVYPETQTIAMRDIYAKRAQINLWLRNWADAENDYTSAIMQNMGEPDWNDYTGRAEARTNMGNFENAVQDYVSAVTIISERIQKTPAEETREGMSRQAMGFFEKSGALRVKMGQMDLALQDLEAAHTLAIALNDLENKNRLQILMSSIQ
ncbi:MAG: hypothetical protein LBQ49_02825 [Rickettsiales bacterium]|jgi:tetratricopeptide (TPR) repeat protein|nr:hypothetical protein [Rickettsiales bacterium]